MFRSIFLAAMLVGTQFCVAEAVKSPVALAVFEFQAADQALREVAPKVSTLLNVEFSQDPRFVTVERAELDKALGEQELALSGTVAESSAAKIGQLTGARLLVTGRVMNLDRDTIIVAKVIGVETSRVFAAKATVPHEGSFTEAVPALAKQLATLAVENEAALLAKTDDPAAFVANLKRSLEGKPRHAVSVTIPEQHFGRHVIDPAAETELSLLLKECGFTLVDSKSTTKAEIEITGEAFSERGIQKGALIGCKARLEIKVRRVSDGEILAADRQVSVAVDLAEHVAAKSALQAAARGLANRILPAVAQ